MVKRFIDIIIAMAGLLFFLPLLIFIYCLLKLCCRGPAIIKDIRVGKNQKLIHLLRFQIYRNPGDIGPYQVNPQGRIKFNRSDKILNLFAMDGLPLLINVLKGDLSLVGPPAEVPRYVKFYKEEEKEIFSIRPGLWWPYNEELTCPKNNKLSWDNHYRKNILPKKIKRELTYIQDTGIGCDFRLLTNVIRNAIYKVVYDRFIKRSPNT